VILSLRSALCAFSCSPVAFIVLVGKLISLIEGLFIFARRQLVGGLSFVLMKVIAGKRVTRKLECH
jgi:hypothetical protein